jgi:membrane protease YdiL (CAAX protease family)
MASASIPLKSSTLLTGLMIILVIEGLMRWVYPKVDLPGLTVLGIGRLLQTVGLLWAVVRLQGGLDAIGVSPHTWRKGLLQGALWSAGFAVAGGMAMLLIYIAGESPTALLRSPLPSRTSDLILFFVVGGLLAPVAEEICFRGILYTYFRRWGILPALVGSTALFVLLHSVHGLPVTQIVGGLVFAVAFETSRNLMVPITIHTLGNLALFSLSLPMLQG